MGPVGPMWSGRGHVLKVWVLQDPRGQDCVVKSMGPVKVNPLQISMDEEIKHAFTVSVLRFFEFDL